MSTELKPWSVWLGGRVVKEEDLRSTGRGLLGVYTVRSSDRPVGPTKATSDCLSDKSDRPVGQTVAEPPTSVNQINVAD